MKKFESEIATHAEFGAIEDPESSGDWGGFMGKRARGSEVEDNGRKVGML